MESNKKFLYSVVLSQARLKWEKFRFRELITRGNGIYLFKFDDERGCEEALGKGPWKIVGAPIYVKKMGEGRLENSKTLPLWVKLYDIPLEYWTNVGFCHIASFLGRATLWDEPTMQASRISFPRICIVIDVDGNFQEKFMVENEFGR